MAAVSPIRTPWTAALLLLVVIWTVWLSGMPGRMSSRLGKESSKSPTASSSSASPPSDRPLILYTFFETENALSNLKFFLEHGLHGGADFVFVLNGETDAQKLLPLDKVNVRYISRPNHCYDLGAHAEVLMGQDLYKKYKRFILMNASIRGPYLPYWAEGCWSEMYLKKVTEKTKLVGMTGNCWPSFHVQSMIWATDITGLDLLLHPPNDPSKSKDEQPLGINHCFDGWDEAVAGEIGASSIITRAGYDLDVMMAAYHGYDYVAKCDPSKNGDVLWNNLYEGMNLHPYDAMFLKTNRDVDPIMVGKMTEWADGSKYSSWDHCPS